MLLWLHVLSELSLWPSKWLWILLFAILTFFVGFRWRVDNQIHQQEEKQSDTFLFGLLIFADILILVFSFSAFSKPGKWMWIIGFSAMAVGMFRHFRVRPPLGKDPLETFLYSFACGGALYFVYQFCRIVYSHMSLWIAVAVAAAMIAFARRLLAKLMSARRATREAEEATEWMEFARRQAEEETRLAEEFQKTKQAEINLLLQGERAHPLEKQLSEISAEEWDEFLRFLAATKPELSSICQKGKSGTHDIRNSTSRELGAREPWTYKLECGTKMKFYFDPETRKLSLSPVREVIFSKNEVGRILPKSQANLKNVKTEASNRARELADYFDDLVNMSGKGRQLLKALSETSDSIRLARRDVSEANNALQKAKRCLARCNGTVDRGIADVVTDYSAFMRGCVDSAKQGRNYQTLLSEPANISLEALKIARNDYVKATTHLEDRKNTLMRREKQFCKCRDEFLNCRATAESLMRKLTERIDTINRGNYRPLVEEKLRGKRETVGGYQQKAEACVQWFCSQRVVELSAI